MEETRRAKMLEIIVDQDKWIMKSLVDEIKKEVNKKIAITTEKKKGIAKFVNNEHRTLREINQKHLTTPIICDNSIWNYQKN